ncbi:Heavy metal transport/detoxification superfamily protein [Forsythia ovata]|uniref:Heavy metal transport/detoxification superfamily protein n=1 Tax=Forsythia ovata TaxID=205694 RepID=A0ABD1R4Q6_9LAMI
MGEEEKKLEEAKKPEEEKVEKKEEPAKDEKPINGEKEENKNEDSKEAPPPPPPPQEIILRVYMHCEGCARKVRRCLKDFDGVEDVITDYKTSRVVVKGEKADPIKVLERVQRKSHRQVELLSPIPPPPPPVADKPKIPEEKEEVQTEEKKEPPVITVALRVYMHCEACAQETRKRIQRMKGVESAEPDLKNSEVTVKGAFEPEKLIDYVYKRMGKKAVIVKVEPEKKEEEKEEKKPAEEGEKEAKKGEEGGKGNEEGGGGGGEGEEPPAKQEAEPDEPKMELKKNEFNQYYPQNYQVYPQRIVQDMYSYPPQIFSDENPNACSIM